ncbi:MAG: HAMP domain-containing histidine kinase [Betaproteobacteria bacterium]|nr:HAMP domain-containing histidine kinase [Betaproteobacteria bacterium]
MRFLFNLSFRYKIPLWGSLLIIGTAAILSSTMLLRSYDELKRDVLRNAASQGRTLAHTLFPAVLQDQVWRAYEILKSPLSANAPEIPGQPESLLVLTPEQRVYVSTQPGTLPMLADFRRLSPEFAEVAENVARPVNDTSVVEPRSSGYLFVVTPIVQDDARLGTLVQIYSKKVLLSRFIESSRQAALVTFLVLLVLLPISWYWGQRTAIPLVRLTERMEELGQRMPEDLSSGIYDYQDELGRLYQAYNRTLKQLREKALIEQEMIHSERLAAVGRLAAGIAHEINNPLLGMLTSLNTLRRHGDTDARTLKTLALVERGLTQIKETVAALLVEAKVSSRNFSRQDVDDVRTLIEPQARKRSVSVRWRNDLDRPLDISSTPVRQLLINLLLNAVQASEEGGEVEAAVAVAGKDLAIEVVNGGRALTEAQRAHLFEPFVPAGESGRGLGLWVCYQIARQLGGGIEAKNGMRDGRSLTRFNVVLPMGVSQ